MLDWGPFGTGARELRVPDFTVPLAREVLCHLHHRNRNISRLGIADQRDCAGYKIILSLL